MTKVTESNGSDGSDDKTNYIQMIYNDEPVVYNLLSRLDFESLYSIREVIKRWIHGTTDLILQNCVDCLYVYRVSESLDNDDSNLKCLIGRSEMMPRSAGNLIEFMKTEANVEFLMRIFKTLDLENIPLDHTLVTSCCGLITSLRLNLNTVHLYPNTNQKYKFDNLRRLKMLVHYQEDSFMKLPDEESFYWHMPRLNTLIVSGVTSSKSQLTHCSVKLLRFLLTKNENVKEIQISRHEVIHSDWDNLAHLFVDFIVNTPTFQRCNLEGLSLQYSINDLEELRSLLNPNIERIPAFKTLHVEFSAPTGVYPLDLSSVFEPHRISLKQLTFMRNSNERILVFPLFPNVEELVLDSTQRLTNASYLSSFPSLTKISISGPDNNAMRTFQSNVTKKLDTKQLKIRCVGIAFPIFDLDEVRLLTSFNHLTFVSISILLNNLIMQEFFRALEKCSTLRGLKLYLLHLASSYLTGVQHDLTEDEPLSFYFSQTEMLPEPTLPYIGLLKQVTHLELEQISDSNSAGFPLYKLSPRMFRVLYQTMNVKYLRLHKFDIWYNSLVACKEAGIRVETWKCRIADKFHEVLPNKQGPMGDCWKKRDIFHSSPTKDQYFHKEVEVELVSNWWTIM